MRGTRGLPGVGLCALVAATLAGCAETTRVVETAQAVEPRAQGRVYAGEYSVGEPYEVDGVWYVPAEDYNYAVTGMASWYGRQFDGRRTASGEVFDMAAMTAAHPTLPMPSWVRVTNLENGRQVSVRVNDRGPYADGRVIDVSQRAAELLGFKNQGMARVLVEIMPEESLAAKNDALQATAASIADDIYVQAASLPDAQAAETLRLRLQALGPTEVNPVLINGRPFYRVWVGPARSADRAEGLLQAVARMGAPDPRLVVE